MYPFTRAAIPAALERLHGIDLSRVLPHIRQSGSEAQSAVGGGNLTHRWISEFYAPFMISDTGSTG